MSETNPKTGSSNQRTCDRLSLGRSLLLEFDSGDILTGKSLDISPRGVLMKPDNAAAAGELLDRSATLYIISAAGRFSIGYPCRVVRQEGNAMALEIHKSAAAAFGNNMTKDLLGL